MFKILMISLLAAVSCTGAAGSNPSVPDGDGNQEGVREEYMADGEYLPGISLSLLPTPYTPASLGTIRDAGVKWVEVVFNPYWRNVPHDQGYEGLRKLKSFLSEAGLKVWSCHLPFCKDLDISLSDKDKRAECVAEQRLMIEWAAMFKPKCLVLHPSSEPIEESQRQERLDNAVESIGILKQCAAGIGAVLCLENLPRTCLGRTSDEILYMIADHPEVMVCFDSNHLLIEDHDTFFRNVGQRIATIHASDYDRLDERHWIEGEGCIDWPSFLRNLKASGYEGVFMHEVRKGDNVNPESIVKAYKSVVCEKK